MKRNLFRHFSGLQIKSLRNIRYNKTLNDFYKLTRNKYKLPLKDKNLMKQMVILQESFGNPYQMRYRITPFDRLNVYLIRFINICLLIYALYLLFCYTFKFPTKLNEIRRKITNEIDKEINEEAPKVKFKDVLGIDEYKEELEDILDYLKNPEKYEEMGAEITKGVLLVGPPGVGKTLLAKALANEAECKFYAKSGSEFEEIFVGQGAKRVKELFLKASANQPSIIFIDEFDAIAGKRNLDHQYYRACLNQLLASMDGFEKHQKIIVIAATNLPESLDPAVKRAGRFDRVINIPYPNFESRKKILQYYLKKVKHDESKIKLNDIAHLTTQFTGADIKNLINFSGLNSIKNKRDKIIHEDLLEAFDRVVMGSTRKTMRISKEEKLKTAYHEAGHTLISLLTKGSFKLHKVTILQRGSSLGHTGFIPEKDSENLTKKQLIGNIYTALGGRAAEDVIYGNSEVTSGCGSDLVKATQISYEMARNLAMIDKDFLLSISKEDIGELKNYEIDLNVQKFVRESYQKTIELLKNNKDKLDLLATTLAEKETLSSEEVYELLDLKKNN